MHQSRCTAASGTQKRFPVAVLLKTEALNMWLQCRQTAACAYGTPTVENAKVSALSLQTNARCAARPVSHPNHVRLTARRSWRLGALRGRCTSGMLRAKAAAGRPQCEFNPEQRLKMMQSPHRKFRMRLHRTRLRLLRQRLGVSRRDRCWQRPTFPTDLNVKPHSIATAVNVLNQNHSDL